MLPMTKINFHSMISGESNNAVLFDAITFKDWFPKSKTQEIPHLRVTPRQAEVTIPVWLLKKKGINDAI